MLTYGITCMKYNKYGNNENLMRDWLMTISTSCKKYEEATSLLYWIQMLIVAKLTFLMLNKDEGEPASNEIEME